MMPPWVIGLALMSTDTADTASHRDRWLGPDKVKHATVAFAIQGGSYAALRGAAGHSGAVVGAAAVTVAVSLLKERLDRKRTGFSVRDLAWDAVGIAVASAIVSHAPQR